MSIGMDTYFPDAFSCFVPETGSTMDEARQLSRSHPYGLVHTGTQSAGRGRLPGRQWLDKAGDSLLVTFWFPAGEFGNAPLPHIAGLALIAALESWAGRSGSLFVNPLELKWPNDLLCGTKKIAGILCESAGNIIYAGIGLNCAQESFPSGFRTEPSSVFLETGHIPEPGSLLPDLAHAFRNLKETSLAWKENYESRLAWKDRRVAFRPGLEQFSIEGTLVGVDDSGALVLDTSDGLGSFASGELSLLIGAPVIDDQGWT